MKQAMHLFFENLLKVWNKDYSPLPLVPWDEDIDPTFYVGEPNESNWVQWKPKEKNIIHDFDYLEKKHGIKIHSTIKDYFNSYWFLELGWSIDGRSISLIPVAPGKELSVFEELLSR